MQGTIFFHNVQESDFKPNRYYTCTAENVELKDYKFGSQFRIEITHNKRRSCKFMSSFRLRSGLQKLNLRFQ